MVRETLADCLAEAEGKRELDRSQQSGLSGLSVATRWCHPMDALVRWSVPTGCQVGSEVEQLVGSVGPNGFQHVLYSSRVSTCLRIS